MAQALSAESRWVAKGRWVAEVGRRSRLARGGIWSLGKCGRV